MIKFVISRIALAAISLGVAHAEPRVDAPEKPSDAPIADSNLSAAKTLPKGVDSTKAAVFSLTNQADLSTRLTLEQRPKSGPKTFRWANQGLVDIGSGSPVFRYSVGVEKGINIKERAFAKFIEGLLRDPRGWTAAQLTSRRFKRVSRGGIKIVIATPSTVDKLCHPLRTNGFLSCARNGYIAINLNRWEDAVPHWTTGLLEYRQYLINHELGHWLWQPHVGCPGKGKLAPVMMQQSIRLNGCKPNPWPVPN